MNKLNTLSGIIILTFFFSSCKKEVVVLPNLEFGVVINEIMPVNISVVADQNGEFDDWIELYNKQDTAIDLSGFYLTDSKTNLGKWKIPSNTLILPDSFLIIWADNDSLQIGLHANFKLSSQGETVSLVDPDFKVIDKIDYGIVPLGIQQSFARIPDGTGEFAWTETPTWNNKNLKTP
jgi:hypothetical protein